MSQAKSRRRWSVAAIAVVAAAICVAAVAVRTETADLRFYVRTFAVDQNLAGGVIVYNERPGIPPRLYAFGFSDPASGRRMQIDDRFKIASLSKPVTAAAVLKLARNGEIDLDAPLGRFFPAVAQAKDARMNRITLRDLMHHGGGWDWKKSFDPFFLTPKELADKTGVPVFRHADCAQIADAMLAMPLQLEPGTAYAYSNLGYCWLGRLIAQKRHTGYEQAVRQLLALKGFSMQPSDVTVRPPAVAMKTAGLIVNDPQAIQGAGGWIADARTYFDFATRPIDPAVFDRPPYAAGNQYYGLGWRVWHLPQGVVLTHFGSMPGSFDIVIRKTDGTALVAFFNGCPPDPQQAFDIFLRDVFARKLW